MEEEGTATQSDLNAAKTAVITSERAYMSDQQKLIEAQQGTWKKAESSMKTMSQGMDQIGVALDSDLGISKGLPGLADNLVRFVASLAAAPLLGQLSAISQANPNQGSGIAGMLASNGAFGAQYTPGAIAAAGATLPVMGTVQVGGPGIAAQPGAPQSGESAREFAHRAMMPFWQSQGFQVGDHAADKYGEHQNGALDVMVPNIAAGNAVLKQALSDPNVYGAIFNNQTYGYGHGATPKPYGAGFTGNPTQDHQDHDHILYKPGGTNNIVPSGGASPSIGPDPIQPPAYAAQASGYGTGVPVAAGAGTGAGAAPFGRGGPPMAAPFGMPGVGQFAAGAAPTSGVGTGTPYPGGIGLGGGAMGGLMAAAGAADMFMPGAGAAAKMGIQLANRAIQFGGQAAGIGVSGLTETFLPAGSPLASIGNSWIGKLAGGVAAAKPALPNMAGKQAAPPPPQGAQGGDQGAGSTVGTNIEKLEYNNHQAPEDRAGADLARNLYAAAAPSGGH